MVGRVYGNCKMHSIDWTAMCRLPWLANGLLSTEHAENTLVPGNPRDCLKGSPTEQHVKKDPKNQTRGAWFKRLLNRPLLCTIGFG